MLDVLKRHTKNFINEKHEKAKFVNMYEDGSIFITDAIIAVYAKNVHSEAAQVKSCTWRKVMSEGLSQERALQMLREESYVEDNAYVTCNVEVLDLMKYVQTVNVITDPEDGQKALKFEFDESGMHVKCFRSDFTAKYHDSESSFQKEYFFGLDAKRLEHVLKLIKDVGYDDMKIYYGGLKYPIEFRSYDGLIRVVIMQLRL